MAYSIWDKQPEQALPKLPFELVVSMAEMTRKKQEEADTQVDKINESLLNIPAIPVDVPGRDKRVGELQQQIYDIADRYSSNMAEAVPALKSLQRDINKEMTTGYLSGVKARHAGYAESLKNAAEYEKKYIETGGKEGMSSEDVKNMLNFELTNPNYNATPIQRNPDGSWQSYKQMNRMATYNYSAKANELGKWLGEHPEKITTLTGLTRDPNTGYYFYGDRTDTYQTSEAIAMAVSQYFKNDPEVASYVNWEANVSGKNDAARKVLAQGIEKGYIPRYNANNEEVAWVNPEKWEEEVYRPSLYNKADAAARAAGSIYTRNEVDLSQNYEWDKLAEEQRKAASEQGITLMGQAPLANVESTVTDPSFFDMRTFTPKTTIAGPGGGMGVTTGGIITLNGQTADELVKPLDTRKEYFNDINTLPTGQRIQATSYLRTLSKNIEQNPTMAAAAERIMAGKGSLEDQKLVYPELKRMTGLAQGSTQTNSNVQSLTSKEERRMVNTLLGTSSDESITVEQLGTGFGTNLRVSDQEGNVVSYKDWVEGIKKNVDPKALVSIQGKLNGKNAFTNKTGDKAFGNAYQIVINGLPYYIHGDYQIALTSDAAIKLEAERVRAQHVAMIGQADSAPTGTFEGLYWDTPIEWTYGSDKLYRLTGYGKDDKGNILTVTPTKDTTFNSAEEMEVALRAMKASLGK